MESHWYSAKLAREQDISLSLNGEPLERVDKYKYFSMFFDKNLNWYFHIENLSSKIPQRTGLLRRMKYFVPN